MKNFIHMLVAGIPVLILGTFFGFCSLTPRDRELQSLLNEQLQEQAAYQAISATVNDQVVTLQGEVVSDSVRAGAERLVKQMQDVKKVNNIISVAQPIAP
ncbi:BON domain-containing protein [Paraflavisolibacter sp. H34]|uniref:BON domain-containing protein n=1 Tax=Huijunlia imazamoxiresistens TaxID=3127457 RepID=UPI0030194E71